MTAIDVNIAEKVNIGLTMRPLCQTYEPRQMPAQTPPPSEVQAEVVVQPDSEDSEWEDVPEAQPVRTVSSRTARSRSVSVQPTSPTGARQTRRRRPVKTVYVVQPQPAAPPLAAPIPRRKPILYQDQVQEVFMTGVASGVRYFGGVFTHAFQLLKTPLGYMVFGVLFVCCLAFVMTRLYGMLHAVVAPVCWIPLISSSVVCRVPHIPQDTHGGLPQAQWADYPRLVEIQSSSFEQLLGGSVGGSALSLEIKKAEMATKDLITVVKLSDLKSRERLAASLFEFVE